MRGCGGWLAAAPRPDSIPRPTGRMYNADATVIQSAIRRKLARRGVGARGRGVACILDTPKRSRAAPPSSSQSHRLSVRIENALEPVAPGTPTRGWPGVSISRSDSELTFALHLTVSEQNLQSMIRPSSHAQGLSASPLTSSVRRVVKLKVGVRGASRRAVKAPPHSRKMVVCLFLCKVLSFAAAAAAVFALAGSYSSGRPLRAGLHNNPRAALGGHPQAPARGSDPSMVLGFGLGRSLAGIGAWGSEAMETADPTAFLQESALSVQTELLRGMRGPSPPPPTGAIEFKWPPARVSAGKPPASSAARRAASVGTSGMVELIEPDMAPPNSTPFQALQRLRTHLSPLSMPPECASAAGVDGPPEPPVALAGIIGAALLAIAATEERAGGSPTSLAAGTAVDFDMAPALPIGFDIDAATVCASLSGAAYSMNGSRVDYPLLRARLLEVGLEYVDAIEADDHFVYIARRGNELFLTFRGSCNGQNVRTDLDYNTCSHALAAFEQESGLRMPEGIKLHRGFLEAWRVLREPVIDKIEALMNPATGQAPRLPAQAGGGPGGRLKLYVTGHSMGGAISQLASWELAHRLRAGRARTRYGIHRTYTFAAPRVGNCAFARHFGQTFPRAADHWALQAAADAVPHLPFAAWGFQHPEGVLKLGCPSQPAKRSGDVGDYAHFLRPKDGKLINWVMSHDMETYVRGLADLACTAGVAAHCDAARSSHFAP